VAALSAHPRGVLRIDRAIEKRAVAFLHARSGDGARAVVGASPLSAKLSRQDVFLPLPAPRERLSPATAFRSTWLHSSIVALRERGLLEGYLRELPPALHETVTLTVAGVWLPIDVAIAHYWAIDRLGLSRAEASVIGLDVTRKAHGTMLGMVLRRAKQSGVTPWTVLGEVHRLWERVFKGAGVAVYQRGPKDALIEIVHWPCAEVPYVRAGMPAVARAVLELFCTKAVASPYAPFGSKTSLGIKVAWA